MLWYDATYVSVLLVISEVDWRINIYDTMYKYFFDTVNQNTNDESSSSASSNTSNKRRRIHDTDPFEFNDDDMDEL